MFAIRLRERNKQRGFSMRTYTSAVKGRKYIAGEGYEPSDWTVESDKRELDEVRKHGQFEVIEFDSIGELRQKIEADAQARARVGLPLIYARVTGDIPAEDVEKLREELPQGQGMETPPVDLAPPKEEAVPMGRSTGRKPQDDGRRAKGKRK